jgi:hypothetical protein
MSEPLREVFSETFDVRDLCVPTVEEYTASVARRLHERAADKGRDWLWEDCRLNAEIRTEARQDGDTVTVSVTLESFGLPQKPLLAPRAGLLPAGRLAEIAAMAGGKDLPPGPWTEDFQRGEAWVRPVDPGGLLAHILLANVTLPEAARRAIASFAASARMDVPALLAHIATLEKVIADCGANGLLAVREAGRRAGLEEAEAIVRQAEREEIRQGNLPQEEPEINAEHNFAAGRLEAAGWEIRKAAGE